MHLGTLSSGPTKCTKKNMKLSMFLFEKIEDTLETSFYLPFEKFVFRSLSFVTFASNGVVKFQFVSYGPIK